MSKMMQPTVDFQAIQDLTPKEVQDMLKMLHPKLNKYIPHTPTPKQAVFMNLVEKEAFFGGAAGGGKSDALLMDALQNVDKKGYAAIIFRKSFADLVKPGALIDRAKEWLAGHDDVRWREKDRKFEFLTKYGPHTDIRAILQFGYLETEGDKYNYQGGEYQYIGFDEVTHITESNYKYMFSRLRKLKNMGIPLKMRSASNPPDDDQGIWVYNRFVNPKTKKKHIIYIPASMDDNPHLDKESYEEGLAELDPVTRARLRDGVWEVRRKGNMFKRGWFEIVDSPPPYRRRLRFWDMASTDPTKSKRKRSNDPDYTVGFLLSEAKGIYYIEDIVRVRKTPAATEEIQRKTAVSDGYNTRIREEQEPGSSGDFTISKKGRDIFKGYDYKGIRSTGSKILRAGAVSAAAERGDIKVVRGCRNIEDFFNEAESFPGGVHDDLVDGLSGAYNALREIPSAILPEQPIATDGSYWTPEEAGTIEDYFDFGVGTPTRNNVISMGSYWDGVG